MEIPCAWPTLFLETIGNYDNLGYNLLVLSLRVTLIIGHSGEDGCYVNTPEKSGGGAFKDVESGREALLF